MSGLPDVKVEVAFNAGYATPAASRTWTDITSYAQIGSGISITHGRRDELSLADPNGLSLTVNNSDGRFTPKRSGSPYYPNVKIGRPIRVTATYPPTSGTNLLTAAQSSFESSVGGWVGSGSPAPTLTSDATRAYHGTKSLKVLWNGSGSFPQAQFTMSGMTAGATYTFAAWLYVPTGSPDVRLIAGNATTDLSAVKDQWFRLKLTFVAPGTTPSIGVRSSGTPSGQAVWVDACMVVAGDVWPGEYNTLTPVTSTRFLGYVDEWPTEWPAEVATVAMSRISATSRTARIGLDAPLKSIVEEETLLDAPAAYYTLGEGAGSTAASDSSDNGAAALTQRGTGAAVVFGNATGPGTDGLTAAQFAGGKYLSAALGSNVRLTFECWFNTSTTTTDQIIMSAYYPGDVGVVIPAVTFRIGTTTAGKLFVGLYDGGSIDVSHTSTAIVTDGTTHHVAVALVDSNTPSAHTIDVYLDGANIFSGTPSLTSPGLTYFDTFMVGGAPAYIDGTAFTTFTGTIAHATRYGFAVGSARIASHAMAGLDGFAGETPAARIARYASYVGIPSGELATETGTAPIAHIDTTGASAVELMRTVESTDGGVLFDARDNTLTYQGRSHRYNATAAATFDVAAGEIAADFAPTYDRSTLANDVTATLSDGSASFRSKDQASSDDYGLYALSLELATTNPDEAPAAATWRTLNYAEPLGRVSNLTLRLTALSYAQAQAAMALIIGDRVTVTNQPSQAESTTGDYFIEGYTETIDKDGWLMTCNVSPGAIYLGIFTIDSSAIDGPDRVAY